MAENKELYSLPEVGAAVATLSPEDRELLDAVQASPFRLTEPQQFQEFTANIDYFVFEPNIHDLNDLGWRYIAQHIDMLLPPELLEAIDPVPFGKYAMEDEQGFFTSYGYLSLSGDEWQHEHVTDRPHQEAEKKPSIRERLEQGKKECAGRQTQPQARGKSEPGL
ncbi:MAG: hypothetical protein SPD81_01590 [Candidatus Faecousia sp.]|nr:hypothetical protein [Candidatus Faecousia sp.]